MKKRYLFASLLALAMGLAACDKTKGNNNNNNSNNPGPGNPNNPGTQEPEEVTLEINFYELCDGGDVFSKYEEGDFVLRADKGSGTVNPVFNASDASIRVYGGNTLSFTAGGNISTIEFTYAAPADKAVTPSTGNLSTDRTLWTGSSESVTFTVASGSGHNKVFSISVTYLSSGDENGNGNGNGGNQTGEVTTSTFDFANAANAQLFTSLTKGGVTLSAARGSGQNDPKTYDSGDLRTYKGNIVTISGTSISKIQFTVTSKEGEMSARVGTLTGLMWTGNSNSVTFDITDGQRRFQKIVVTHMGEGDGENTGSTTPGGGTTTGTYNAHDIMEDICIYAWGDEYDPNGDLNAADSNGVVTCNYAIFWEHPNPVDSEACLVGVFEELLADEDFCSYLTPVDDPEYEAGVMNDGSGSAELYLITDDFEFVVYMYNYYDTQEKDIGIVFECGPADHYIEFE